LISVSTQPNDLVLDPFMGSGSTGVACEKMGRRFIGMESDENYLNVAQERLG
jgi:site-specific DNA-methyltransferase (adenine-specific)